MARRRRTKAEIERDNIEYVLRKNREAIETAYERYDRLMEIYEKSESKASSYILQKVEHEGGRFNFDNKNYYEVLAELTRIHEFNSDPSSRIEYAKGEGKKFKNLFGPGMWTRINMYGMTEEESGNPWDLNEEAASRAFRAYRNIERNRAAEIVGAGGFGSDNFIAYLYSMEIQGKDSEVYGQEMLDLQDYFKEWDDNWNRYGINKDFSDLTFIPSSYSSITRLSREKGDIFDNEW